MGEWIKSSLVQPVAISLRVAKRGLKGTQKAQTGTQKAQKELFVLFVFRFALFVFPWLNHQLIPQRIYGGLY